MSIPSCWFFYVQVEHNKRVCICTFIPTFFHTLIDFSFVFLSMKPEWTMFFIAINLCFSDNNSVPIWFSKQFCNDLLCFDVIKKETSQKCVYFLIQFVLLTYLLGQRPKVFPSLYFILIVFNHLFHALTSTKLPPLIYTFKVIKINNHGI